MQAIVTYVEAMRGTSKKTGNPYEIYTVHALIPVNEDDKVRSTDAYVRRRDGHQLIKLQCDEHVWQRASKADLPAPADLTMEQFVTGDGELAQKLVDLHIAQMPASKAA